MKRIQIILVCLVLCIRMSAQTEACMAVLNEIRQNKAWSNQKAIDYVLAHKKSFDFNNEIDTWFYNLGLGVGYYSIEKMAEALPYLRNVCTFLDKYENELNVDMITYYYMEAVSEYNTEHSKVLYINKLKKIKSILEKYNQEHTKLYDTILSEIENIKSELFTAAYQYVLSGQDNDANILLEEIIDNFSDLYPKEIMAYYRSALALGYFSVGRFSDAEQIYLHTLAELESIEMINHEIYRSVCDGLGDLYCQVHNYSKGLKYFMLSKYLHEINLDFDDSYIECLNYCASAEVRLGNRYIAKMFIDIALKYMRSRIGYKTLGTSVKRLSDLISIYNKNIDPNSSSDKIEKLSYIRMLSSASIIYEEAGFWEDAIICMKESISMSEELGEHRGKGTLYNNMGSLYLNHSKFSESLPYFSKAIPRYTTDDYGKIEVLNNYATALWLLNSNECSEIAIQTSKLLTSSIVSNFSFLSQEEKYNYYTHFEDYLPILNLMIYEERDETLYGYIYDNILTTKGLLLRASNEIKETIMRSGDDELIGNYNQMLELRQQVLAEEDSIRQIDIKKEIEILDKKLSRSASNYGAFIKFNNINWKSVLENLNDDDIAIEFYNIPIMERCDTLKNIEEVPRYCAVILKKGFSFPQIFPLCKETELMDLDEDSLYSSDVLYRFIWKPLESQLKGVKNIYFSADRELHKIGIEYAQMQDEKRMDECYNLYRLSSTRVLAENHKSAKHKDAVLFGGLLYDLKPEQLIAESRKGDYHSKKVSRVRDLSELRYGVKYLPGTKDEVENIYNIYKSISSDGKAICSIISDIEGTEESFKSLASKNIGIIHLATHGFYWSKEDTEERNYVSFLSNIKNKSQNYEDMALFRSGLFFSGANIGLAGGSLPNDVDDGVLTAKELSVMNLGNVDMVVMSACQSGVGETTGEGVFGLQRGFKLAGANTLLMSLWKVDDEATKILMTEFYKNYLSGKTKRKSLHLAQQMLRITHPEPEYWAGFILLDALN